MYRTYITIILERINRGVYEPCKYVERSGE